MAPRPSPWQVLGLTHDASVADVRRVYAALIKQYRPDSHPEEFARVREAYEVVLPAARRRAAQLAAQEEAARDAANAVADADEPATSPDTEDTSAAHADHAAAQAADAEVADASADVHDITRVDATRPPLAAPRPPARVNPDRADAPPVDPGERPVRVDAQAPEFEPPPNSQERAQVDTSRPELAAPRPPLRVSADQRHADVPPVDPRERPARVDAQAPLFESKSQPQETEKVDASRPELAAPRPPLRVSADQRHADAPPVDPRERPARVDAQAPEFESKSQPPVRVTAPRPEAETPPSPPTPPVRIVASPPQAPPRPPPRRAPMPAPAPAPRKEPTLVERIEAVRQRRAEAGEPAALLWLRTLLRRSRRASIDDRQALEMGLLEWFLADPDPPLLLMFDAGRAFGWHRAESRLAHWLPAGDDRRLERLLTMSRDLVFARHRSSGWLRRLFTPEARVPWFAFTIPLVEARGWDLRWTLLQDATGRPALQSRVNERARRRLAGGLLLSTDLIVAWLFACTYGDGVVTSVADAIGSQRLLHADGLSTAAMTLVFGVLVALARRAAVNGKRVYASAPRLARLRGVVAWMRSHPRAAAAILAVVFMSVPVTMMSFDVPPEWITRYFVGAAVVAGTGVGALVAWIAWALTTVGERFVFRFMAWREAVDRWEFERLLAQPVESGAEASGDAARARPVPLFGERAGLFARLKAINAARTHEEAEIKRHERPPRVAPVITFTRVKRPPTNAKTPKASGGLTQYWWLAWIAIAALRLLAGSH